MGSGILFGQETKSISKVDAQTLQSAYSNGVLGNAKDINNINPKAVINRPHIVDTTSSNIPSDLLIGIREVFFYNDETVLLQINGINTNNEPKIWNCTGIKNGDTFTISVWAESLETTIKKDNIDNYLTTFQMDEPAEDSEARFWVNNDPEALKEYVVPEINDYNINDEDTWSSTKIKSELDRRLMVENITDYLSVFQSETPDETSSANFWVNDGTSDSEMSIPEINDESINSIDTWSSSKINNEINKVALYGLYGVCNNNSSENITVSTTDKQVITINNNLYLSDNMDQYISINEETSAMILKAGSYLISGSINIVSSSVANGFACGWEINAENSDRVEPDISKNFVYIGLTGELDVNLSTNPTVINITEDTTIQFYVQQSAIGDLVISPSKCRLQVTKLK